MGETIFGEMMGGENPSKNTNPLIWWGIDMVARQFHIYLEERVVMLTIALLAFFTMLPPYKYVIT